jgi:hypothetical protein
VSDGFVGVPPNIGDGFHCDSPDTMASGGDGRLESPAPHSIAFSGGLFQTKVGLGSTEKQGSISCGPRKLETTKVLRDAFGRRDRDGRCRRRTHDLTTLATALTRSACVQLFTWARLDARRAHRIQPLGVVAGGYRHPTRCRRCSQRRRAARRIPGLPRLAHFSGRMRLLPEG